MLRVHCSGGMYFAGLKTERFQAAPAKVSGPAENSYLSWPDWRVYPDGGIGSGERAFGCRVAVQ
jgi:hypothetical protein